MKQFHRLIAGIFLFLVIFTGLLLQRQDTDETPVLPTLVGFPPTAALVTETPFLPENAVDVAQINPVENHVPAATVDSEILENPQDPTAEPATPIPSDAPAAPIIPGQTIIHFAPTSSRAEQEAYLQAQGITVLRRIEALNTVIVALPDNVTTLSPAPALIVQSESDYWIRALETPLPNDPYFSQQWALPFMGVPQAWQSLPDALSNITIAVIDSGICADHPDLQGRVLPGYDYVEKDTVPQDDNGHGCSVAGIIAANTGNAAGIAGIAPYAQILPLRVLDKNGLGTYSAVAEAIIAAADNGASIINLSIGGVSASDVLARAVTYAQARGIWVIAAAGNNGREMVLYPAAYPNVIAVGAVGEDGQRSSFSNYGAGISTYAPGANILTLAHTGDYKVVNGTSFAAPHAAAAVGLWLALGKTPVFDGGRLHLDVVPAVIATPVIVEENIPPEYMPLLEEARANGGIDIMVRLAMPYQTESALSAQAVSQQRISIQAAQQTVLSALEGQNAQVKAQFQFVPYLALHVDEAALLELITAIPTGLITRDNILTPQLAESTVRIQSQNVNNAGYRGDGQTVAILDSGVDKTHSFLVSKIVSEACYSRSGGSYFTLCPNGQDTQESNGAAVACSYPFCDHGTHVAGIAAGSAVAFDGVAPDAEIIAIQVFNGISSPSTCAAFGYSSPCILTFDSQVILGLERVYALKDTFQIAAVNLSLGGGKHTGYCDLEVPFYKDAIDLLRSEGIATIVASGNNRYLNALSAPACVSTAISVGATFDSSETIWSQTGACNSTVGSNSASFLDLLAPGASITSSVPGNTFATKTGTSMATPHVTGTFAVLRGSFPSLTIEQILAALQSSPIIVTDPCNTVQTPFIQLSFAIDVIVNHPVARGNILINEIYMHDPQWIELYNAGSSAVVMTGWSFYPYNSNGTAEVEYLFPTGFTLNVGGYVRLHRGTGTNNASNLYMGNYTTAWAAGNGGLASLFSGDVGVDTVQWGSTQFIAPPGTAWLGHNPASPAVGQTLGRDPERTDSDDGYDWSSQTPSPNAINTPTRPTHDAYANAKIIGSIPYEDTVHNTTATRQFAGAPDAMCINLGRDVWYRYTPTVSGQVFLDTWGSDFDTGMALFLGISQVACNDDADGTTATSRIAFNMIAGSTYYIQVGGLSGASGTLRLRAYVPPTHDSILSPRTINAIPYTDNDTTTYASKSALDPQPACHPDPVQNSVWYRYTPPQNDRLRFSTAGSAFDTVLTVWTGTPGALTSVGCHDDVNGSDLSSLVEIDVTGGVTYYVMVSGGASGASGALTLDVRSAITPKNLTLTSVFRTAISMTWEDIAADETGYLVERSPNGVTSWTVIVSLAPNMAAYTHTPLVCGTTHFYRVRVSRPGGLFSPYSNTVSATTPGCPALNTPTNVAITTFSQVTLKLIWQDASPGETTTFYIQREISPGSWQEVVSIPATQTMYEFTGLTCNTSYTYRVLAYRAEDAVLSSPSTAVTGTTQICLAPVTQTVGLYKEGVWLFRAANTTGAPDTRFTFGVRETGWSALVGDWDGDGTDGIGLYKNGVFILRNTANGGIYDTLIRFGTPEAGWIPLAGDWNGDGIDTIGLFRAGLFLLRNSNTTGVPDMRLKFGEVITGGLPVVGDWDGNGGDTIGIYHQGYWYLTDTLTNPTLMRPFQFGPAIADWQPIVGDWNADNIATIGIYYAGVWRLRNGNGSGMVDVGFNMGSAETGWQPLAGYRGDVGTLSLLGSSESFLVPLTDASTPPIVATEVNTPAADITPENTPIVETPIPTVTPEVTPEALPETTPEPTPEN